MPCFLFATLHAGGNFPPTVLIAQELAARGHEVRFLCHPQQLSSLEEMGFRATPYRHARPWSATVATPGVRSMLAWLPLASDPGPGRDLLDELARTPGDLIVLDCILPGALPAARSTGLPVALLMHAFFSYWAAQWSLRTPMGAWLHLMGRVPTQPRLAPDRAILTTLPELDPLGSPNTFPIERIAQTGPVLAIPKAVAVAAPDAPVLVSMSTISYPGQLNTLRRVLDALASLAVEAIVTTGPSLDPAVLQPPPNVRVLGHVPHTELLPQVRLVIGHGGHGTTMQALAHGLPLLILPMSSHADQPLVARAVAAAGAGRTLHRRARPELIREALERLLSDPRPRREALRLAERIREARGAARAADCLEELLTRSALRNEPALC